MCSCGCVQVGDKLKEGGGGTEPLIPTVKSSCVCSRASCCYDLGLLEKRVTANEYNDQVYATPSHFYPRGSGLLQDDNATIYRARRVTERFDECEADVRSTGSNMGDFGLPALSKGIFVVHYRVSEPTLRHIEAVLPAYIGPLPY